LTNRLNKIITRSGDNGTTGLADGSRRLKSDPRIVCLGDVDELNATIGLAFCKIQSSEHQSLLHQVQHDLFDLGAELSQVQQPLITRDYSESLEQTAQQMNSALQPLKEFILPGGSELLSFIHLARTVCRRAERSLVHLSQAEPVNPESVRYLNRLSDLLFILGRFIAKQQGHDEIHWQSAYSRRHS
jgi:cob(I)alamin adenosyltransferase